MSKKRINVIKPTLRHKKRYVLLKILDFNKSNNISSKKELYKIFSKNFQKIYGLFSQINANITILEYYKGKKEILIRVNKDYLDLFLGSLFYINSSIGLIKIEDIKSTIKKINGKN